MARPPLRVLLIEDNSADAALIEDMLRVPPGAYELLIAPSLAEGIALGTSAPPDLVLLDLGLPDANGLESFGVLRRALPETPVVVLSGLEDESGAAEAVRGGAQDYLVKGRVDADGLSRAIRYAIERAEAARTLRAAEERYRATFAGSLDAMVLMRAIRDAAGGIADFEVMDANQRAESLTGLARERLVGARLLESLAGLGTSAFLDDCRRVVETREPFEHEHRARDAKGAARWLRQQIIPLGDGVAVASRDITARKQNEAALEEWRSRYEAAVLASEQVLYDWDPNTGQIVWAGSTRSTLGYAPEELGDMAGFALLVHPADRARFAAEVDRVKRTRTPFRLDYRLRRADGTYAEIENHSQFFTGRDGARDRMVGFLVDVTQRKSLELELRHSQKMEAVGQLASGVAHDFRNLLLAIRGHLALAKSSLPPGHPAVSSLEQVELAADQASGVAGALLTFARRAPSEKAPVQVGHLVEQTERLLRRTLPAAVRLSVSPGPPEAWVDADATQLQQVLTNLALNARDAMPRGGSLVISVDLAPTDAASPIRSARGAVRITVKDSGAGIAANVLPRIFDPFFTTKPRGQGTGLGLSIVHGIVRDHRGAITVATEAEAGTAFTVWLPARAAPEAMVEPKNGRERNPGRGRIALLAEKNAFVRSILTSMLSGLGYEVLQAGSIAEALAQAERRGAAPGLLVLDADLPDSGTLGVLTRFRDAGIGAQALLILEEQEAEPEHDEHTGLLRRPFQMADLASAIAGLARPGRRKVRR